jgi:hypothetical protein
VLLCCVYYVYIALSFIYTSTHAVGASLGFVYVRESHKSYSNNGTCTAGQIHAIYSLSDGRVAIILAQDADDKCGERRRTRQTGSPSAARASKAYAEENSRLF